MTNTSCIRILFKALVLGAVALATSVAAQLPPGIPDPGFGTGGMVTTNPGGSEMARGVVVQPDGNIVAVGGNALVRYLSNGALDATFGNGGIAGGQPFTLTAVTLQPDGKIVACGFAPGLNGQSDFVAARFLTDGSPDLSFNTTGRTMVSIAGNTEDIATCVTVTPQGKVVVGGHAKEPGQHERFALMQCLSTGYLDTGFGTGGKLRTDVGASRDMAHALALQSDGKLLLAGQAGNGSHWDFAVVRYTTNGSIDANFGTNGRAFVAYPGNVDDYCFGVQVDVKNRIVLGGKTGTNGGNFNFAAARLLNTGILDAAFGTGGRTVLNTPSLDDHAGALLQHPGGNIFLAGNADKRLMVTAFDSLGVPDITFGASGVALADFGVPINIQGHAIALDPAGKLVAAGGVNHTGDWDFALARFTYHPLSTSIKSVESALTDLRLYPNPATTHTTLTFELQYDSHVRIGLYNSMGQQMHYTLERLSAGVQNIPINLDASWPAGWYQVVIATPDGVRAMSMLKH